MDSPRSVCRRSAPSQQILQNAVGEIAANKTNLAIGYVQSGKTISMTTLACLARDNGYRIIVFFAGSTTNLVKQTTERIEDYLLQAGPDNKWKIIDTRREQGANLGDVMEGVEEAIDDLSLSDHTLVIITMKNWQHLQHLADVFGRRPATFFT